MCSKHLNSAKSKIVAFQKLSFTQSRASFFRRRLRKGFAAISLEWTANFSSQPPFFKFDFLKTLKTEKSQITREGHGADQMSPLGSLDDIVFKSSSCDKSEAS